MQHKPFLLVSILIAVILTPGCEKRDNGGKFTVKGQWLKDCSGAEHANEPIRISIEASESLFNKPTFHADIGSGVTDDQGRFSIQCDNHGSGLVYLNAKSKFAHGSPIFVRGGDGNLDDLGALYDSYTATANLELIFTTPLTDTFFMSEDVSRALPAFYIYPASGTKAVTLTKTGTMKPQQTFQGYYGIGRTDFNRPVSSGDSRIVLIQDAYEACGGKTSVIVIP